MKTIAFFNNKSGVGKTSLVYHLAWMYSELGIHVIAADFDPQANLTSMFIEEGRLEELWPNGDHPDSVLGAIKPILKGTGDIRIPHLEPISEGLGLIVGDLGLSGFEDKLSEAWLRCQDRDETAFLVISALYRIVKMAAEKNEADVALIDVGSNLGAINRAALIASDYVVVPLGDDIFSLQGLKNVGPTIRLWRDLWKTRLDHWAHPEFELPQGRMIPLGYTAQQHGVQFPIKSYDKWLNRMPGAYHQYILEESTDAATPANDPHCLGILRPFRSLKEMAKEARKPIFKLKPADGAIGSHSEAVAQVYKDFKRLAERLLGGMKEFNTSAQ
ncbi:MAG: ParA family protein [Candidatus Omnitrophota bacterium]